MARNASSSEHIWFCFGRTYCRCCLPTSRCHPRDSTRNTSVGSSWSVGQHGFDCRRGSCSFRRELQPVSLLRSHPNNGGLHVSDENELSAFCNDNDRTY